MASEPSVNLLGGTMRSAFRYPFRLLNARKKQRPDARQRIGPPPSNIAGVRRVQLERNYTPYSGCSEPG